MTWEHHDKHRDESKEGAGTVMFLQNESMYKNTPKLSGSQHEYHTCASHLQMLKSGVVVLFQAVGPIQGCCTDFPRQHCQPKPCQHVEKKKNPAFLNIPLTNALYNQAQYRWIMRMSLPTLARDLKKSHGQGCDT